MFLLLVYRSPTSSFAKYAGRPLCQRRPETWLGPSSERPSVPRPRRYKYSARHRHHQQILSLRNRQQKPCGALLFGLPPILFFIAALAFLFLAEASIFVFRANLNLLFYDIVTRNYHVVEREGWKCELREFLKLDNLWFFKISSNQT